MLAAAQHPAGAPSPDRRALVSKRAFNENLHLGSASGFRSTC